MNQEKKIILNITPTDFIIIIFSLFLFALNIIYYNKITNWKTNLTVNFLILIYILFISYKDRNNNIWKHFHYWYLVPLILIFFKELYYIIEPIRGVIYDDVLIKIERMIFRTDPTHELYQIANPYLTELLQIVYGTFFFLPLILSIDLVYY